MKRLLAAILALIMALSLCACGGDDTPVNKDDNSSDKTTVSENNNGGENGGGVNEETTLPSEPSAEEMQILIDYSTIVYELNECYDYGKGYDSGEIIGEFYTRLMAIDQKVVEKWKDSPHGVSKDYNELKSEFVLVEDVPLELTMTVIDRLGNTVCNDRQIGEWRYSTDKTLVGRVFSEVDIDESPVKMYYSMLDLYEFDPLEPAYYLYFSHNSTKTAYDESGKVTETVYYNEEGSTICKAIPTYDDTGRKICDTVLYTNEEDKINYTYDANGRVIQAANQCISLAYSYDANGNAVKIERTIREKNYNKDQILHQTLDCSYDADGRLLSCTDTQQVYDWMHTQYEYNNFTFDENGRLLTMNVTSDKCKDYTISMEKHYGTYYIYTPAEVEAD